MITDKHWSNDISINIVLHHVYRNLMESGLRLLHVLSFELGEPDLINVERHSTHRTETFVHHASACQYPRYVKLKDAFLAAIEARKPWGSRRSRLRLHTEIFPKRFFIIRFLLSLHIHWCLRQTMGNNGVPKTICYSREDWH